MSDDDDRRRDGDEEGRRDDVDTVGDGDGDGRTERKTARPDISHMVSVKLDNLSFDLNEDDLRAAFEKFGEIGDVYIPKERGTYRPRGFGFVRFLKAEDADAAVQGMHERELGGRELRCAVAERGRPERYVGGRGRNDYNDRRGGGSYEPYRRYDDRRDRDYYRRREYRDDYRRDDYRRDDSYRDRDRDYDRGYNGHDDRRGYNSRYGDRGYERGYDDRRDDYRRDDYQRDDYRRDDYRRDGYRDRGYAHRGYDDRRRDDRDRPSSYERDSRAPPPRD